MKKVAVIMGSDSDLPVVTPAIKQLKELNIETEVRVMSAHRTPKQAQAFAENAADNGFGVPQALRFRSLAFRALPKCWTAWTLCLQPL